MGMAVFKMRKRGGKGGKMKGMKEDPSVSTKKSGKSY